MCQTLTVPSTPPPVSRNKVQSVIVALGTSRILLWAIVPVLRYSVFSVLSKNYKKPVLILGPDGRRDLAVCLVMRNGFLGNQDAALL